MSRFFKRISAVLCGLTAGVMGLVGFYSLNLPDSYNISKGDSLMIHSPFSISSRPCKTAAASAESRTVSKSTLMLFGAVPIKDVTASEVERPYVYPCGQAFGIKLVTDGVMVVDTAEIDGKCPAEESGIEVGDIIVSINEEKIRSNEDIAKIISNSGGRPCSFLIRHEGVSRKAELTPVFGEGGYKAGIWVRDSSAGIGTLTFFDGKTNAFAGLGHPICDVDTKEILPLSKGIAGEVKITGITKSEKGTPGQLMGEFSSYSAMGDILSNCSDGIYGKLLQNPTNAKAVPLGFKQEIRKGSAVMISSVDGKEPKEYSITIEEINLDENAEHDLVVKITDKELLEKTGGIVQGMSGSPIIQDGRLVGAVTHVFVDDPTMGYGIFSDVMYRKAQQSIKTDEQLAG